MPMLRDPDEREGDAGVSDAPLRIGIVGVGAIHPPHADAIQSIPDAVIGGFFDVIPERAEASAAAYGAPAVKQLSDLWPLVDAVTLCTPSGLHARDGILAAAEGKHVLVEKPIDVNLTAAHTLVDACRKHQVKLGIISQHRFAQQVRQLKRQITEGRYGRLLQAELSVKWFRTQAYYEQTDWRGTHDLDGGGCLINQSIHYLDLLRWFMGPVRRVQGHRTTLAHGREGEDLAMAFIEFESGAHGSVNVTVNAFPGFKERIEIYGESGAAVLEADRLIVDERHPAAFHDPSPYGPLATYHPLPTQSLQTSEATPDPTAEWSYQHRAQIEDFIRAIREDREPFVNAAEHLPSLQLIRAIYRSADADGKWVTVAHVEH